MLKITLVLVFKSVNIQSWLTGQNTTENSCVVLQLKKEKKNRAEGTKEVEIFQILLIRLMSSVQNILSQHHFGKLSTNVIF